MKDLHGGGSLCLVPAPHRRSSAQNVPPLSKGHGCAWKTEGASQVSDEAGTRVVVFCIRKTHHLGAWKGWDPCIHFYV